MKKMKRRSLHNYDVYKAPWKGEGTPYEGGDEVSRSWETDTTISMWKGCVCSWSFNVGRWMSERWG